MGKMQQAIAIVGLWLLPLTALAHLPVLPEFANYDDAQIVAEPDVSQAFYGQLSGFPHRYEFTVESRKTLQVEILVPDIAEATNDVGGIIVTKRKDGFVDEVAKLNAETASWDSFYEPFGGDRYRQGPQFTETVEPGEYVVEVSTPRNEGKYVLVIGQLEDFSSVGLFGTMQRIYQVKQFYGKPPIAVLQSPFYYVPFSILLIVIFLLWYRYRRHA